MTFVIYWRLKIVSLGSAALYGGQAMFPITNAQWQRETEEQGRRGMRLALMLLSSLAVLGRTVVAHLSAKG
jgi:hypothetical protein